PERGVNESVTRALVAKLDFQAVGEEGEEIHCDLRNLLPLPRYRNVAHHGRRHLLVNATSRLGEKQSGANPQVVFNNEPDRTQCSATQRIRILASRRLFVNRPKATELT